MRGESLSTLPAARLLTPRRLDLAIKWRFFRHLLGGDGPDSERLYRWHIDRRTGGRERHKRSIDDYLLDAKALLADMRARGFDRAHPVPLDPDGELLGGAHRVSCALALGCDVVVAHQPEHAWAPAWDIEWFVRNGMAAADLRRLLSDWERLCLSD